MKNQEALKSLADAESELRSRIGASDVPFLGLMRESLSPETATCVELLTLGKSGVAEYVSHLRRFPALFSVHLTSSVMEGMGQRGVFELYPHISRAIGSDEPLTHSERDELWRAFRHAILELGLDPSPVRSGPHFMANEYLRQAGVPLAYAADLAERMMAHARRIGLPDADDPESIVGWQRSLMERLNPPFSATARRAILLDAKGFYTQAFIRASEQTAQMLAAADRASNSVQSAMVRALAGASAGSAFRRTSLPYLTLNQYEIGFFVPGGSDQEIEFRVDGEVIAHRAGFDDTFVPVVNPLPRQVSIAIKGGETLATYTVWEDARPNRLLLFSDSGRIRLAAQLAPRDGEPMVVEPGVYHCLSRFAPEAIDADAVWDEPAMYRFTLTVDPGRDTTLRHGPAAITFQGESRPSARWSGMVRTTREGVDVHYGTLDFSVDFPSEWSANGNRSYVLCLSAPGAPTKISIPFRLSDASRAMISIGEALARHGWKPGLIKLLAEVSRSDGSRALLRSAMHYWFGLDEITPGMHFECSQLPANLLIEQSENIRTEARCIRPRDVQSKNLRLVFRLDERRCQTLSWNVQGLFIEVETVGESGVIDRQMRAVGSVESVSLTSRKRISISASEPGVLSVGDWSVLVDFAKQQTKHLPASLLASRMTPQSASLRFRSARSGLDLELLRLVQPHFAEHSATRTADGRFVAQFFTEDEIDELAVRVEDVISGKSVDMPVPINRGAWTLQRFTRSFATCLEVKRGGNEVTVQFDLESWPPGAWIFAFDAEIGGRWGHLENERQDVLAAGLVCDEGGRSVRITDLIGCLPALSDAEALTVLNRAQIAMSRCYMRQSWESIQWVQAVWRALLMRFDGRVSDAVAPLANIACARPPEDASPSWLLQMTAGAALPEIYALPANVYRRINDRPHPVADVLRAIATVGEHYPAVFPETLHLAAASGFSNLSEIGRGGMPRDFRFDHYVHALRSLSDSVADASTLETVGFRPRDGQWLGPVHHKFAIRSLETAYERTLSGNEIRRGQAMGLCRHVSQRIPSIPPDFGRNLAGLPTVVAPWPRRDDESLPDDILQRNQNLEQIEHLLSLLAFHCRAGARKRDALQRFLKVLHDSNSPVESSLAYLLQIGDALFAYYLLLWELVHNAGDMQ